MLFNSYVFVLAFLPICLLGYFALASYSHKIASVFLIGMSLFFYGYFNPPYVAIIMFSILFNYLFSRIIIRYNSRILCAFTVAMDIAIIFYFKYFNFFKNTINSIFDSDLPIYDILLPLGISFFTFQQISFVVDSYNGKTSDYGFIEYSLFVTFFPQLIAGPIVLHSELIPQFRDSENHHFNPDNFYRGLVLFSLGLSKKVLLADVFSKCVTDAFNGFIDSITAGEAIIVMLAYTFQIYFDFSAYSDMALGIARMFNFDLPMNFDSPYKAMSIPDFWKRWHMTLTRFLRQYIYFPLGGSKKGTAKTYLNIIIVFLVSGLWHGANWTFILWGLLHGLANCVERLFSKGYKTLHPVFQWTLTFLYTSFLWLLFRATSVSEWIMLVMRIVKFENLTVRPEVFNSFALAEKPFFIKLFHLTILESKMPFIIMLGYFLFSFYICLNCENNYRRVIRNTPLSIGISGVLLGWSIISLGSISEFIYFNF